MRLQESLRFFYARLRPKELVGHKFYRPKNCPASLSLTRGIEVGRVARYWSMTPRKFRTLDKEEQAELHAIYAVEMEIEHYNSSEQAKIFAAQANTK